MCRKPLNGRLSNAISYFEGNNYNNIDLIGLIDVNVLLEIDIALRKYNV